MPDEHNSFDTSLRSAATKASDQHDSASSSESYLDHVVDLVWKKPEHSDGSASAHDYAKGFLKTAALFMSNRVGMAGTVALYALDQAHPSESIGAQATEMSLGAIQGFATRKTFDWFGDQTMNFAVKGVGLGLTSRIIDTGLDAHTYVDKNTGAVSLGGGLSQTWHQTFNLGTMTSDAAVFTLAGLGMKGLNNVGAGYLQESRLVNNMLTGATFGMSSGATSEFNRQRQLGQGYDFGKIVERGVIQGALDSAAAAPGGLSAAMKAPDATSAQISQQYRERVKDYTVEARLMEQSLPLQKGTKFENWPDYMARGVKNVETPVRVYELDGHTGKLIVPEDYASRLDRVRELRDTATRPLEMANSFSILSARLKLDLNPYGKNALPEDFVKAFDETPDRRLFKDVTLLPEYPHKNYYKSRGRTDNDTRAEVDPNTGNMWFFGPRSSPEFFTNMSHEWAHLAEKTDTKARQAFEDAVKFESEENDGYYHNSYGGVNSHENWAVHLGEVIAHGDQRSFDRFIGLAPIRSAVFGRALASILADVPPELRSVNQDMLQSRVEQIEQKAVPNAMNWLEKFSESRNPDTREPAKNLLEFLNSTKPAS